MANRSIWKGTVGFGLVSIPVKLYGSAEDKTISLNQLHGECGSRIKMPKHCPTCERDVDASEIVKGYELEKGRYVPVTAEDLERVRLDSIKSIQVDNFVPMAMILVDPRRTAKKDGYFLAPEEVGAKAFVLFVKAMEESGVAGLAKISVRDKEQLCAVYPFDGILFVQTLHWQDELRGYEELIPMATVTDKELEMASSLIASMTSPVDWGKYRDEYRDRLREVIDAKLEGREIEIVATAPTSGGLDLDALLEASLANVGSK